jgi:hypothetical protein
VVVHRILSRHTLKEGGEMPAEHAFLRSDSMLGVRC